MTNIVTEQKETGSHFTPPQLANFVAERICENLNINSQKELIKILDPSCGDGELLLSLLDTLPKNILKKSVVLGIDTNPDAVAIADTRIKKYADQVKEIKLIEGDFLELSQNNSILGDYLRNIDVIIANPPYVRTQILGSERAQELAKAFNLTGRVDLYHAFLIAMTLCLEPAGVIGVITSNRFLSTKGGQSVRDFIKQEYSIRELYDLGDTKLFEAAVLPAVMIAERSNKLFFDDNSDQSDADFVRIYECQSEAPDPVTIESIFDVLKQPQDGVFQVGQKAYQVAQGKLIIPKNTDQTWSLLTTEERAWVKTIERNSKYKISELLKVRVGIKTTADKVFIRADWKSLPQNQIPEEKVLRPLLSSKDVGKWFASKTREQLKKVLYTHEIHKGRRRAIDLSRYPQAGNYLEGHREILEGRKYVIKAKRKWYEIWVPQSPELWQQPKIVFPDISPIPQFFLDLEGFIVDGNCYWITAETDAERELLFLILAVSNSQIMTRYHDLVFNNKLYAGRRRYLTQYVENYPLPDPQSPDARHIIELAKQIYTMRDLTQISMFEEQLEAAIADAFGVHPIVG